MQAKAEEGQGEQPPAAAAGLRQFSRRELAGFDGTIPGKPVLIAYRGRVYDVTYSEMWEQGRHFWLRAGRDVTGQLNVAPHGEEVLTRAVCVGRLGSEQER